MGAHLYGTSLDVTVYNYALYLNILGEDYYTFWRKEEGDWTFYKWSSQLKISELAIESLFNAT